LEELRLEEKLPFERGRPNGIGAGAGVMKVLDKDLNMLGETLVPQLNKKPGKHFAKDGKIWIYENMNDEMGFIRLGMSQ